jgi:hypothetical protein
MAKTSTMFRLRLDEEQRAKLERWSVETGLSMSVLMRGLLDAAPLPPDRMYPSARADLEALEKAWATRAGTGAGRPRKAPETGS